MDIQHEMALIIAKQITKMEFEMKEDKFNILVYGIEVFLNEAIKVVVIVCLGILMDKLRLIIFSMIFLLILRRYVGEIIFLIIRYAFYIQLLQRL